MNCIVIDLRGKWATVIEGKLIGASVHKDYSLFHFKAHDIKALKLPLTKFIYLKATGELDEVIDAEQLKDRGCNFKTAKRNMDELTASEEIEASGAYELVKASINPPAEVAPAEAAQQPAAPPEAPAAPEAQQPADAPAAALPDAEAGEPKPATAAIPNTPQPEEPNMKTGLPDTMDQQQAQGADDSDVILDVEAQSDEPDAPAEPSDPLDTVKPSRRHKRR
jgi:hypothetical protein